MEKSKILNIAGNISLLKQNYKNYLEIRDKEDFDSYNKKKNLYNNWVITLCDMYNSLLKYYGDDTNECWEKIKLLVSKEYEYNKEKFTLRQLIKKYRNKNVHSENSDSVENNLLPVIVSDSVLEDLQKILIDAINYELKKINPNQMITHVLKSGGSIIAYEKLINSINDSMKKASIKERELLEPIRSAFFNIINQLKEDSIITEDDLDKMENDLEILNNTLAGEEYIKIVLEQPNGRETLDFLNKINKADNFEEMYDSFIELKNKISDNQEKI